MTKPDPADCQLRLNALGWIKEMWDLLHKAGTAPTLMRKFSQAIDEMEAPHGHCLTPPREVEPAQVLGPDEFVGEAQINGHWYTGKHMIRVAQITFDGSTCTVPLSGLVDVLGEDETYQVRVICMRKAEFDRLEEFQGW